MPRKATGWSTTSFRDGNNFGSAPGYVPGANDGAIPPETGYSNTSYRTGFSDGYVAGSTSNEFANTTMRNSFDPFPSHPVYPPVHQPPFGSHVDVAYSGTSTRDSFDHFDHHSHRHSTGGLATKIFDNINSRFGPKHTDVAYSGTSTRSSDDPFGPGSSGGFGGGNTSFR